jgi:hypothetical protein
MSDYLGGGPDGHRFVSTLSGEETRVKVRRKLVDATYTESSIPSKHVPGFEIDDDVRVVPPNDLVNVSGPCTGYTVLGAGKTAMDTCNWLMDEGVAPDSIRWVRPRDAWLMDRASFQPLELVGSYMELQGRWVQSAAEMEDGSDFARRMEEHGIFARIDPSVEPRVFRGATISRIELDSLRQIENVVRRGKVLRIAGDRITFADGSLASDRDHLYVDCTAAGVRPIAPVPIFEPDRITMQYVTPGIASWTAGTLGVVEALRDDDAEKNRLCPPAEPADDLANLQRYLYASMSGLVARLSEPDLAAWNEASRLNPASGAVGQMDDARVSAAFALLGEHIGQALNNLERLVRAPARSPA